MRTSTSLEGISLEQLQRIVDDRRREVRRLEGRRSKLEQKLASLDRAISRISGDGPRGRSKGGRSRNAVSLPEAIGNVLSRAGTALGVGDIEAKVRADGYRSESANFRSIVNQTLIKDRRFVSERRGVYRLRGSG